MLTCRIAMAVSAFRSTTRRGCETGGPGSHNSKRDPSPSPARGFHRRSSSVSDFSSAKYLSDCSSSATSEYRSRSKGSRARAPRSICPSDSESDVDFLQMHRQRYARYSERDDESQMSYAHSGSNINNQHAGIRRSSSTRDFCESKINLHHPIVLNDDDFKGIRTADGLEEKTIRPIYTQLESLRGDPPAGDLGTSGFVDAMRSEVQRAVSEIRAELAECMKNNSNTSGNVVIKQIQDSQATDVTEAGKDIRTEFSTKLEQSEQKVRDLWSQLAVEEQRCAELAKIVKELLPLSRSPRAQRPSSNNPTSRRRFYRRRNSEDRLEALSLDDEARKYFEECVAISTVNGGELDDTYCEGDDHGIKAKEQEQNTFEETILTSREEEQAGNCSVGSDGVVLPWLQWEAEAATSDKSLKVGKRHFSYKSTTGNSRGNNGSDNPFYASNSGKTSMGKRSLSGVSQRSLDGLQPSLQVDKAAVAGSDPSTFFVPKFVRSPDFIIDDNIERRNNSLTIDVDDFLSGKIGYKSRVESGELVMCQGLFI